MALSWYWEWPACAPGSFAVQWFRIRAGRLAPVLAVGILVICWAWFSWPGNLHTIVTVAVGDLLNQGTAASPLAELDSQRVFSSNFHAVSVA
jgi:hypothetical protein